MMKTLIVAMLAIASASCGPRIPEEWVALGMPADGLLKVYGNTDSHGYYADYAGSSREDAEGLLRAVSASLRARGYNPACVAFDGHVRGFQHGTSQLAVKVDLLGGTLGLSVFSREGKEPLLHGVCFGEYELGEKRRLR